MVRKDLQGPDISIVAPTMNDEFELPPAYEITVSDTDLDKIWYTFDGGTTKLFISSSTGIFFCAGWDLAMFESVDQKNIDILLNDGARISKKIHFLKKLVIIQIQGPAIGTGANITLLADVRNVANKNSLRINF